MPWFNFTSKCTVCGSKSVCWKERWGSPGVVSPCMLRVLTMSEAFTQNKGQNAELRDGSSKKYEKKPYKIRVRPHFGWSNIAIQLFRSSVVNSSVAVVTFKPIVLMCTVWIHGVWMRAFTIPGLFIHWWSLIGPATVVTTVQHYLIWSWLCEHYLIW